MARSPSGSPRAIDAAWRGLVAGVQDMDLPATDTYGVLAAETYAYHTPLLRDPAKRRLYAPITLQRIETGAGIGATDYYEGRRRMVVARNTIGRVFERVDLLVTPTSMRPPPTVAASPARLAG